MKTALVTGATGFIGGRLVSRLLDENCRVHCLVRPTSDVSALDPRASVHRTNGEVEPIATVLRETKPDIVFHLASLYLATHKPGEVVDLINSNVAFPSTLAEAMDLAGVRRLINTGTAWQHFRTTGYNPVNLYAATKQAASDILAYYCDALNFSLVTLELYDTYGCGDTRRKLVQLLVDAAASASSLDMSPGEQTIDLSHVDDVVDAFMIAARRVMKASTPINERFLISGERMTVRQLVTLVGNSLESKPQVTFGARAYREREVMEPVAPKAADRLPGWQPKRQLATAVPELVQST